MLLWRGGTLPPPLSDSEAQQRMRMPDVTSFIARTFGGTVKAAIKATVQASGGWHRIGLVLSVLIVAAAGAVLFHILRDIDLARVADAISGTPPRVIAVAALFVAAAYVTITFYDYFSLRTIGRGHVPYRVA